MKIHHQNELNHLILSRHRLDLLESNYPYFNLDYALQFYY